MPLFIPRDRKSLFRQFLAGMYDAVVITDPNGHILEVNPRTVEFFGREPEEFVDKPVSLLIPGLKPEIVGRIRKGIEGDRHVVIDANGVDKSGRKFACEVAVSSIDLMNPGDLVFTIRNIERRRAYMNVFRAKANAFQVSQAALFCCDGDGCVRDCNDAFLSLFGLSDVEEARKRVFVDLLSEDPLPENFKRALSGERTVGHVGGGERTRLEVVLAPNAHGRRINGVVGSIRKD